MKVLLAASLLAISAPLWATSYYVSNCDEGSSAACVAGNDANAGTSPSAPKRTTAAARDLFNAAQPGDQVLLARGGGWTNAHMRLRPSLAKAAQPIVLGAYTPEWCVGACATTRPVLTERRTHGEGGNDLALIQLDEKGSPSGYVVKDLDLRGGENKTWGIFVSEKANDVTIQNVSVKGFSIGVYCGEARYRVQLLDSVVTGNTEQGLLWGCVDSLIEGNLIDNNGFKRLVDSDGSTNHGKLHNIYIGLSGVGGKSLGGNITVRNNTLTRNAQLDGKCDGVSLVVHGNIDGLLIENNLVHEVPDANGSHGCYGIAVDSGGYPTDEVFTNVVIRGNTIVNTPHTAIGCGSCVAPVIENNVIVQEAAMKEFYGIVVPDQNRKGGNARNTGAKIRNNSIYVAQGVASTGINLGEYSENAGSHVEVTNNLLFMAAPVASGNWCFHLGTMGKNDFTAFANNLCHQAGGEGRRAWSKSYARLADAQAAGFDLGGKNADPQLAAVPSKANGWSMKLLAGSPAVDAGNTAYKARNTHKGYVRTGVPDIGAFEHGVTP